MVLNENKWIGSKKQSNNQEFGDVVLSIYYSVVGNKSVKNRVGVKFYNNADQYITKTGYMVYQLAENRLYFKNAEDRNNGFKLSKSSNVMKSFAPKYKYLKIKNENEGSYQLHYDNENKLYYIDLEDKL